MHAGLKGNGYTKSRRGCIEPELFINPFEDGFPTEEPEETQRRNKAVTLKIQKIGNDRYTALKVVGAEGDEEEDMEMDPLNPSREIDYKDYKLCTEMTRKTAQLKFHDVKIARYHLTTWMLSLFVPQALGNREDADGRQRKKSGNVYIHYLRNVLKSMTLCLPSQKWSF